MTAVLAELGLPAEGPIYFAELAPFKGGLSKVTTEALAVHHAAEYLAHIGVYEKALDVFLDAIRGRDRDEDPPKDVVDTFRRATRDHFDPAVTAWTAAAALMGWDGPRIGEALDMGDSLSEFAWEWLAEWLSAPGDEIDGDTLTDLIDRLTVEPQRREVEGQLSLDLSGRR